ncbi:MAG: 2-(1,2-epoxy-1,2-dihydrophenyl)acetyl-CoA isomerase PaaG [Vulcanimicrobiaceae bacterium]
MSEPAVRVSRTGSVLTLTLNRPEKLNAFDDAMTRGLLDAFAAAQTEAEVRVIVLRGEGRAFSAGQDLEAFVRMRSAGAGAASVADHLRNGYNKLVMRIRSIEKPVVASLGGIAAGVGLSIALACDVRIAADDAVLTLGFSKIGLVPDGGASFMLPLLAGFGRGLELAWTSDHVDARRAHALGLINRVVAPGADLAAETATYAATLAAISPVAAALTKRAFNAAIMPQLADWLEREAMIQEEAAAGPDLMEGVGAFLGKRVPVFTAAR